MEAMKLHQAGLASVEELSRFLSKGVKKNGKKEKAVP
jgi:hypothetical protein